MMMDDASDSPRAGRVVKKGLSGDHSGAARDREDEARALLDLVRQRLFGIGMSLEALAAVGSPEVIDRVNQAVNVIEETMALVDGVGLGSPTDPPNFAPIQARLARRAERHSAGPDGRLGD